MITLPPYLYDRDIYPLVSPEERLWMNKLYLSEKLGYVCGPTGTTPPADMDVCVRPIYNIRGMGEGGFYKANKNIPADIQGMYNRPGYFWTEWVDGPIRYSEYINDVPFATNEATTTPQGVNDYSETTNHIVLPDMLKGLSRYLVVEAIGDTIIEVSFRMIADWARQEVIDDYRTIDPDYVPEEAYFGKATYKQTQALPFLKRGYYWKEIDGSRSTNS